MSDPSTMNLPLFYRGLLYALGERRDQFVADGEAFHRAFLGMLEMAKSKNLPVPADELIDEFDPVFGVSPHAAQMVFEGERDLILSLMNPRLVTAQFKITKGDAKAALDRLDDAPTFRVLAAHLDEQLRLDA